MTLLSGFLGSGKTTILNALSFALFGDALTNIKRDNLVNKTNGKNMLVSCEFDINGKGYKIERGRKPALIKFYVDGVEEINDEAQGDSRETQKDITSSEQLRKDVSSWTAAGQVRLSWTITEQVWIRIHYHMWHVLDPYPSILQNDN